MMMRVRAVCGREAERLTSKRNLPLPKRVEVRRRCFDQLRRQPHRNAESTTEKEFELVETGTQ